MFNGLIKVIKDNLCSFKQITLEKNDFYLIANDKMSGEINNKCESDDAIMIKLYSKFLVVKTEMLLSKYSKAKVLLSEVVH